MIARPLAGLACVVLLLTFAGSDPVCAQSEDGVWKVYLNGNEVRALASAGGETVYAATGGGLVKYENGTFTQWTRAALGLASDSLRALALAEDGRMWLGTERAGISIFDPVRDEFRPFNSLLQPIPGDRIRAVHFQEQDGATHLLVGAEQGYAIFVDGELRFVCQEGVDICPLPSFDVRDLLYHNGELWLATGGGVVAQVGDESWDPRNDGLGANRLTALASHSGELFAISEGNVWRWDASVSTWVADAAGLPLAQGFAPRCLFPSGEGLFVAGVSTSAAGAAGVFRRSGATWTRVGTRAVPATALTVTGSGTLVAGATDFGEVLDGLWVLAPSAADWTQHKLAGPPARANYRSLLVDDEDRLWFSTAERSRIPLIGVFDGQTWVTKNGGQDNSLRGWTWGLLGVGDLLFLAHCCCPEADLSCRLETFSDATNEFDAIDGIREAWDFAADARGRVWVCTNSSDEGLSSGIHRYDPANPSELRQATTANSPLSSDQNPAIDMVGNRIWIGSFSEGVDVLNLGPNEDFEAGEPSDDTWTHYSTSGTAGRAIIGDAIRRLEIAPNGDVWIGTTQGLSIYSGGTFTNIGPRFDRFPTAEVTALAPTRDGGAWVATRNGGLTRMIREEDGGFAYRNYGPPNLPNPNIEALALSRDERTVWCGTSRGLASFTPVERTSGVALETLAAYPNPYHPRCQSGVRLEGLGARATGVIVDLSGRIVHRFTSVAPDDAVWDGRIDGASAVPGLYVARVNGPRGIESVGIAVLDGPCP